MSAQASAIAARGRFRTLTATLVAGALYDFAFAAVFLAAPGRLASALAVPPPGEPFYLRLIAALLLIVGGAYLLAARDPETHRPLVVLAIVGRLLGFAALAGSTLGRPELSGLWLPAFGDLAFSVGHLIAGRNLWR
jgi:hypothetical protein